MADGKRYADASVYEEKLARVMQRFGVEKYNFDWSRKACFVEFWYKGQYYRFEHDVMKAQERGQNIRYGSDAFAQLILALEDIARITERGIYELPTWIAGLKSLPPAASLPSCFAALQFDSLPTDEEIQKRYRMLAKACHPDAGGDGDLFAKLTKARDDALKYLRSENDAGCK